MFVDGLPADDLSEERLWELAVDPNPEIRAEALCELAMRADRACDHARAITLIDGAIDAWEKTSLTRERSHAWFLRGCIQYYNLSDSAEALTSVDMAIDLLEPTESDVVFAEAFDLKANILEDLSEDALAEDFFLKAWRHFDSAGRSESAASSAAGVFRTTHDLGVERQMAQVRLDYFESVNDPEGVCRARHDLVGTLRRLGEIDQCIALAHENMQLANFLDQPVPMAHSRLALGQALTAGSRSIEAIAVLEEALLRFVDTRNWWCVSVARSFLARNFRMLGRLSDADHMETLVASYQRSVGDDADADERDWYACEGEVAMTYSPEFAEALARETHESERDVTPATRRDNAMKLAAYLADHSRFDGALDALSGIFPTDWETADAWAQHTLLLAHCAIGLFRDAEARHHAWRVWQRAQQESIPGRAAEALDLLSWPALESDADLREARRLQAIALYLQVGNVAAATRLSLSDLPAVAGVSRAPVPETPNNQHAGGAQGAPEGGDAGRVDLESAA